VRGLTLYTGQYAAECAQWLKGNPDFLVTAEDRAGPLYSVRVFFEWSAAGQLVDFFYRLLLQRNPLYGQSEKLRTLAAETLRRQDQEQSIRALGEFLNETDSLNVEGYLQFRMFDQDCALNLLLYSLVRRLRHRGEEK